VELLSEFSDFATPPPRKDPRAELRRFEEQLERERRIWIFLGLAVGGVLLGAGAAVNLHTGAESILPAYLGALLGGGGMAVILALLPSFLAFAGGRLLRGVSSSLQTVKDPVAVMYLSVGMAVLGLLCGAAAGAATGVSYAYPKLDTTGSLGAAYLGAFLGLVPALLWSWRSWKAQRRGVSQQGEPRARQSTSPQRENHQSTIKPPDNSVSADTDTPVG
jgi:hypothetical protein